MNADSIRKLRRKFIWIAMLSFLLVMLFTGAMINLAHSVLIDVQAKNVLKLLINNSGYGLSEGAGESASQAATQEPSGSGVSSGLEYLFGVNTLPREYQYVTRYFTIVFDSEGNPVAWNMDHIASVSRRQAIVIARKALDSKWWNGDSIDNYYFMTQERDDGSTIVACVDMYVQSQINSQVIRLTVLICGAGLLITFIIVLLFSKRAIQPEIENVKKQKEFITNASHELKTPLAVIRANTELMEMMNGESEWTQSTMRQVDRMNGLIQNLVMIARAQEGDDRGLLEEVDVSSAVRESVDPYRALAQQDHKTLENEIQDGVTMIANEARIRQLTAILVDNAFKYCDPDGKITVGLTTSKRGKTIWLYVSNSYADGANVDYSRFFERFYRQDKSHSATSEKKGGYGIGLSMAESICQLYHGTISASWKDGIITFTCQFKSHISQKTGAE